MLETETRTSASSERAQLIEALIEVAAGFHPDLTGRENVVTNGLIMGLDRHAITARMEAIEAFADIGEHFDQPVKTYSSGMFMRVAFAAAAHVDPDILVEAFFLDRRFGPKVTQGPAEVIDLPGGGRHLTRRA